MKLNNIFIALSFLSLLSCAKDEIDIDKEREQTEELRYDATLSLSVGGDGTLVTKSDDTNGFSPDSIKRLSAAVFMDDKLVAFKDSTQLAEDGTELPLKDVTQHITKLDFIKVPSGNAQLLLIANYKVSKELQKIGTKLSQYGNIVVDLSDEINGRLTMSSDILSVSLEQGLNFIGLSDSKGSQTIEGVTGTELRGSSIDLYRSVSRVQVNSLAIKPLDKYLGQDGNAIFKLDTIYVANVKSKSYLFRNNATHTNAEYTITDYKNDFWCGAFSEETGALKTGEATQKNFLCYDFISFIKDLKPNAPESYDRLYARYPFLNAFPIPMFWGHVDKDRSMSVTGSGDGHINNISYGGYLPIGTFYYVYSNQREDNDHTLMIIKGRYIYTPKGKSEEKTQDCYYTVVINKDGEKKDYVEGDEHDYIKRNYFYAIDLTIKGPGSSTPYDREKSANISSSVKVKPWNTVMQDETVE